MGSKSTLALVVSALVFTGPYLMSLVAGTPASAATASQAASGTGQDFQAVKAVCSRCHNVAIFNDKPRTWNRWTEVFQRMTKRGANPNEEQVDHIVRYFLANLTIVNVNSSPADEVGPVLGIDEQVAAAIVARRQRQKFKNLAELASFHGVNPAIVKQRKARILF